MTNTEIIANLATIIAKQNLEISELNTEVQQLHHELLARMNEGEQTDDAYFLELMGAVERGEISDAEANQAWYEYINHKDEPQTQMKTQNLNLTFKKTDEPQTACGDFANRLAYERGVKHAWEVAQKVFNSTVTFYEAEDMAKQIDKDINVRSKESE